MKDLQKLKKAELITLLKDTYNTLEDFKSLADEQQELLAKVDKSTKKTGLLDVALGVVLGAATTLVIIAIL